MRSGSRIVIAGLFCIAVLSISTLYAAGVDLKKPLPSPDGKSADMRKPVQVFILMGQSNMLGFGKSDMVKAVAKEKYPYLVDDAGNVTVRKDVRNIRVMCSGNGAWKTYKNEWMTLNGNIGPEIGIGYYAGAVLDAPVLVLKSCIGNRSLGYDLLPPSAPGYEGNKDDPTRTPKPGGWYAGVQYDGDTKAAKDVLKDLGTYYPGATKYEIRGFCFWQGAKDQGKSAQYEENLVRFIKDLRKDFKAPDALFVCATMGQEKKGGQITDAQLAVDGKTGKYKEFRGNVATFYSNPVSMGGSANGHYSKHGETYMNVGEGMGKALAQLLVASGAGSSGGPKKEKVELTEEQKARLAAAKAEKSAAAKNARKEKQAISLLKTAEEAMAMRPAQVSVAKSFYNMILKKYPDTAAAKSAAEKLQALE